MAKQSLEPIWRVIETGQRPIVVACTDFSDYICKYPTLAPAQSLMTEWVCAHAAVIAGLHIPQFDQVSILSEHRPASILPKLHPNARLDLSLFGSKHVQALDMDKRTLNMLSDVRGKSKLEDKDQLLRIALFDIWVANEDRHGNNYNLLLAPVSKKLRWMVIDHGACFNTGSAFNHELVPLTYEDSIVSSELFSVIFQKPPNFVARIHSVCDELIRWQTNARQHVEQWLVNVPNDWGIDKEAWLTFLRDPWLSDEWAARTRQTFLEHTQLSMNP